MKERDLGRRENHELEGARYSNGGRKNEREKDNGEKEGRKGRD